MALHGVILCGGFGTRLTPRSCPEHPKQFQDLLGTGKTMVQATAERIKAVTGSSNMVVTNHEQARWIRRQLPDSIIVEEPESKNTAPAIGLAAVMLKRQDPDAVMAVLPCDHHFQNEEPYRAVLQQALNITAACRSLVTIGLEPTWAHPKLGYIQYASRLKGQNSYQVLRFCEKPGSERAEQFLSSGDYLWNSGQFFWHVDFFLEKLQQYHPAIHSSLIKIQNTDENNISSVIKREYSKMEKISIDYALMEKAAEETVVVLGRGLGWNDIGSWDVWGSLIPSDASGNHIQGAVEAEQSTHCIAYSDEKKLILRSLDDLIVVYARGHLLVTRKDLAGDVGGFAEQFSSRTPQQVLHGISSEIEVNSTEKEILVTRKKV